MFSLLTHLHEAGRQLEFFKATHSNAEHLYCTKTPKLKNSRCTNFEYYKRKNKGTHPASLVEVRDHDDDVALHLPHHLPSVLYCLCGGSCGDCVV